MHTTVTTFRNLLKLIRVKHWIKNLAVFLPAFFAARPDLLLSPVLLILFFAFCMAASGIYVINDLIDLEQDRIHPEKRHRPLASGFFSRPQAHILLGILFTPLAVLLFCLPGASVYVLIYLALNLSYSFKLKQISIVDVTCISLGFVIRILAGGGAVGVYVSPWMISIVFLLAISMAFAKRRDDLVLDLKVEKKDLRESLNGYTVPFLDVATSITLSITLVSYIMYSTSPEVIKRLGSDKVYITSLFVFLGIMRYLQITMVNGKSGSPTDILWRDRFIQTVLVLWIAAFTILLYGKNM